jgi:hypothetical protein
MSNGQVETTDRAMHQLDKFITLVTYNIRFPELTMPNKPEYFGMTGTEEQYKNIMTLGRLKVFPKAVMDRTFRGLTKNPVERMKLSRSRVQGYLQQRAFQFAGGLAWGLVDEALIGFIEMCNAERSHFNTNRDIVIAHYDEMKSQSVEFWQGKSHLYSIAPDRMAQAIRQTFPSETKLRERFSFNVLNYTIQAPEMLSTDGATSAEQLAVIRARNEVASTAGRELGIAVSAFQRDVVTQLRQRTTGMFNDLRESVSKGEWNQKSINSVIKFCDNFKSLNFMNDIQLERFLEAQKAELAKFDAKDIKKDSSAFTAMQEFLGSAIEGANAIQQADAEAVVKEFQSFGARTFDPF